MSTIRAVVVDDKAAGRLAIGSVDAPVPGRPYALVRVHAISLNRGEVRSSQSAKPGTRPGWDFAGVVEQAASDGSGPKAGDRVVGVLRSGAWAELVAVQTSALAVLPDSVSFAQAATLPVAGLTALFAIERGGSLLGRRVLVTGASGGVGTFGVSLAANMGAHVTGLVRQERHAAAVKEAGAHEVVSSVEAAAAAGPYDHVLESVGGEVLAMALASLAQGGTVVSFGASGGGEATVDIRRFYGTGRATLYGLSVFTELAREPAGLGLARLAGLVAEGKLKPHVALEEPWTEIGSVAQRLIDRDYPGKAVLTVS